MAGGGVSVATACNTIGGAVQSRQSPHQILGFGGLVVTTMGCQPNMARAEQTTLLLLRDTVNIARAGTTITFFNTMGASIAQWRAIEGGLANADSPTVPPPRQPFNASPRIASGDYVLSEINGVTIGTIPARPVSPPRGAPASTARSLVSGPPPSRIVTSLPTLFLRDNGDISGSTGCNRYNTSMARGAQSQAGLSPVITTKMTCLSPQVRALEGELLAAFRSALRVDAGAAAIEFYGVNGARLARFRTISARP
jgi:heat shock protein HslJ